MAISPTLAEWLGTHATAIALEPDAPLDDLEPLAELIGDARVVAIGESAHHVEEFYLLRHRLLRFLVERCGFTDYVFETSYLGGRHVDAWIQGGPGTAEKATAAGDMTLCQSRAMYAALEWLRGHNQHAATPVRFTGAVGGSGGAPLADLLAVAEHLRRADPDALPLVERLIETARRFHDEAPMRAVFGYAELPRAVRDGMSADLSRLSARMRSMAGHMRGRGLADEHHAASMLMRGVVRLDHMVRDIAGDGLAVGTTNLDAFMAEVALDRLARGGPDARVVLGLHNVHLRRGQVEHDGPAGLFPAGHVLAEELGAGYVPIAFTAGGGRIAAGVPDSDAPDGLRHAVDELPPPTSGSLEAAFATGSADGAVRLADLRAARDRVADASAVRELRSQDGFAGVPVLDAFDAVVHVPTVRPTERVDQPA